MTLGLVRDLASTDRSVSLTLAFTGQTPATKVALHSGASRGRRADAGRGKVQIKMGGAAPRPPPHAHAHGPGMRTGRRARRPGRRRRAPDFIPEVRHTVAVSSGQGRRGQVHGGREPGPGAPAGRRHRRHHRRDVYGPDVPLMLGAKGKPGMFDNKIIPVEAHGLKVMSIGLLVNEREPLVWRGPMIHSVHPADAART